MKAPLSCTLRCSPLCAQQWQVRFSHRRCNESCNTAALITSAVKAEGKEVWQQGISIESCIIRDMMSAARAEKEQAIRHVRGLSFLTLFCLQACRQRPHMARTPRPAEALFPAYAACQTASCSPDEELALKLYWGRQRGIAVLFATDAMEHAQRCMIKSLPLAEELVQHFVHISNCLAHNLKSHR